MASILLLAPHVADMIAAGEVVERPASVIKELVENAIDAGATAVTVEIKNGGMTYMRVTDNGGGIAPDDAETAFLRHATSKLRDEKGLEAIATLGFRGEALAAISAVSRVELLTRTRGADEGTSVSVEGGVVTNRVSAGCPEGTTMVVRDLFYNTPARLKFMKTDRAESAAVSALVQSIALSHPEVSVRYIKDGKEELHTPGDGRLDSCVYSLFGRDFAAGLLTAQSSDETVSVKGYVCAPSAARGNRSYQYFFVNGRAVKSKTLQAALEQAYRNTLFTGRFPACVLYITLRASDVDVNVHPAKTEVKFVHERQVFSAVYYAALGALEQGDSAPQLGVSPATKKMIADASPRSTTEKQPTVSQPSLFTPNRETPATDKTSSAPNKDARIFISGAPADTERISYPPVRQNAAVTYRSGALASALTDEEAGAFEVATEAAESAAAQDKPYRLVGETLGTYILVERGESLWLIDKHAAHERVHFDRLKSEKQVIMSQTLLQPLVVEVGRRDVALLLEHSETLEGLGFELDAMSDTAVAVRRVPEVIALGDADATLGELAETLRLGGSADSGTLTDALKHTIACKAAIKAGKSSEPMEMEKLIEAVMSGAVRYCPHGRPVAVELTKTQLDKSFKRI